MAGMLNGREALVLAVTLWTALSINDILMLPGGLPIIAPGWLSSILLALLLARVLQRLQNLSKVQAIGFGTLCVFAAATTQAVFDITVIMTVGPHALPGGQSVPGFAIANTWEKALLQFRFSLIWNGIVFGFYVAALSLLNAQRRKLDAEMRALRYELNPHFLFNTLNSIAGLIEEGSAGRADRMVLSLSRFLQKTLSLDPLHDVPLAEEIALQRDYLEIEHERFADRMAFDIRLPAELEGVMVPNLILQPLIENAVKHGVGPSRKHVAIVLEAKREGDHLVLSVENDLPTEDMGRKPPGMGIGLRNIRERLQARFGNRWRFSSGPVDGGRYLATITLPLRNA
ncbi:MULTISPECIES: sensor histidine kinase [unclassified Shinella]|jgi:two-component system sensor histidine kinase AlgZ|uniref:sensor histidine kinase n=1 Tax=unclassified Shinella TaxID=2643062 RepID=UPI0003C55D27|nr:MULTISPECIES: histidine kinase [unclassified Shinella]MCA0339520.1 histidine kinase [Pseudomonadota bacterium]EYR80506.1 putative regulator of cell autolysis [Shinella sp. DD12]MCO5150675.1 histidine kinase [Shinella sp.]MDC7263314.1 histidine kinase [Shinella sp. HY16]MDC7270209.1 histidine kinase [Shinella sp. YZ44]